MRSITFTGLLFAVGCMSSTSHEGTETGSCQIAGPQPACIEYSDASSDELELEAEPMCQSGTWRFEACTHAMALGGCRTHVTSQSYGPFTVTNWFYPGPDVATTDAVMARCAAQGATFVAP